MRTVALHESDSVVFDASGSGQISMGPATYGHSWNISLVSTSATTPTSTQLTFQFYVNFVAPGQALGGTYSGQNDSDDVNLSLQYGEKIIGVWTGGAAGDVGTMVLVGTRQDVRG